MLFIPLSRNSFALFKLILIFCAKTMKKKKTLKTVSFINYIYFDFILPIDLKFGQYFFTIKNLTTINLMFYSSFFSNSSNALSVILSVSVLAFK